MIKIIKKLSIAMLTASILFATIGTSAHAASKDNKKIQYYKEYQAAYYQNNRERILPKQKKYNQEHQEEIKEYYQEHKEELKVKRAEYRANKKAENKLKLKMFDPNKSKAYNLFKEDLKMKGKELVNFASRMYDQISKQTSLTKLGREQKRNMKLLYLWFDENWHIVQPYLYQQKFIKGE